MIRADSILKYIDMDRVDAPEFLYTFQAVQEAMHRLWLKPPELAEEDRAWLSARGVTSGQLDLFRSFSQVGSRADRIVLGMEIHPALQRWIGDATPRGVALAASGANGTMTGCHLRFLSTVPKVKFGSSCPLVHISSNVYWTSTGNGLWLVEGIFDGLALDKLGIAYASPSSGTWSAEQLQVALSLIKTRKPAFVVCAHDRDRVGLKENLFLWSVLRTFHEDVRIFLYPAGVKDMSELVCKHHEDPRLLGFENPEKVADLYLAMPYERLVNFDTYLEHRNTAYSNDRYLWNEPKP
jgi:hypothetical protein